MRLYFLEKYDFYIDCLVDYTFSSVTLSRIEFAYIWHSNIYKSRSHFYFCNCAFFSYFFSSYPLIFQHPSFMMHYFFLYFLVEQTYTQAHTDILFILYILQVFPTVLFPIPSSLLKSFYLSLTISPKICQIVLFHRFLAQGLTSRKYIIIREWDLESSSLVVAHSHSVTGRKWDSYWAASVALGQVAHTVDSNNFNNQPNKSFAKRISYRLLFRLNISVNPKINKNKINK